MNPHEQAIRYAPFEMPVAGAATPIAKGLSWLRMPLPFALDHINLWLLEDHHEGASGWAAIDTGVATEPTRLAWQSLIRNHFERLPMTRVICTHFHPDHVGLAGWLCRGTDEQLWRAPLWMNYAEYSAARIWSAPALFTNEREGSDAVTMASHFHKHGITDPATLEKLRARRSHYPSLVPEVPPAFRRIYANEVFAIGEHRWRVIAGYGHSPEHCALFCDELNILVSGDMVLPRISTNMSVWAQEPDADPLRYYLESLTAFEPLPDDVLVLPSHGKPFGAPKGESLGGLKVRIAQLREHHKERLDETFEACRSEITSAEVLPVLFKRELDLHQLTFALGETIAHLNYLWHAGAIRRFEDEKGFIRFKQA